MSEPSEPSTQTDQATGTSAEIASPLHSPVAPEERFRARLILSIAVAFGVLALSIVVFSVLLAQRKKPSPRDPVKRVYNVAVYKVQRAKLQEVLNGFGTARSDREVLISAQVSGEVVEVHPQLRIGAKVRADAVDTLGDGTSKPRRGDLLIRIDPRTFQERVTQARNRLDEVNAEIKTQQEQVVINTTMLSKAKEDYASYETEFERVRRSRRANVASESEVTRAQLELNRYQDAVLKYESEAKLLPLKIAAARQKQKSIQNDLQIAELALKNTEVRPPFDGRISEVSVEVGQFLPVGSGIIRLTDPSLVEIPIPLPLADFSRIESAVLSGKQPLVAIAENETAAPRWEGRVVRAAPEADETTRTVKVFVQVDNRDTPTPLLPGTFVNARISGPIRDNVFAVPRDAIVDEQMFVVRDGTAKKLMPTVKQTLKTMAIIEADLQDGDQIILTNLDVIFDGAPIEIQNARTLDDELKNTRSGIRRLTDAAE